MPDRYELVFEASGYVTTEPPQCAEPAPEPDDTSTTENEETR